MIYEYAVDPALVIAWAKNRNIGLAPQFGIDQRRLISDLPNDWDGVVTGELLNSYEWDDSHPTYIADQAYLDALLSYMKPRVRRGQKSTDQPWLRQALDAHDAEPFHAILTGEKVAGRNEVITPDVVQELRNDRWYLPTIDVTTKTAEALADQLEPLLRTASQIILVDPYFEAEKQAYQEVLAELVHRAIYRRSTGRSWPGVTVMTGVADRDKPGSSIPVEEQLRKESLHRCGNAKKWLGRCTPQGLSIKFQCIAEFTGGDRVHNRFLLTDVGGATIPYGTQALGDSVFDDITPLFAGQYRTRWRQYGKGEGLRVIGEAVQIQGERR